MMMDLVQNFGNALCVSMLHVNAVKRHKELAQRERVLSTATSGTISRNSTPNLRELLSSGLRTKLFVRRVSTASTTGSPRFVGSSWGQQFFVFFLFSFLCFVFFRRLSGNNSLN